MKLHDFTEALENKYINTSASSKALNEDLSGIYNYLQITNQIEDSAKKYNPNIESVDNFAYEEDYYGDMVHYFDIHINGTTVPCEVTDDEIDEYGMDKAIATAIWRDMANFDPDEEELEESFGDTSRVIDVARWAYYNDLSEDEAIREVKKQLTKEGSVIPDNIKTIVFDTYDEEAEAEGYLTEDKDLSKVKGSMTQLLQDNRSKIDSCSSAKEIYDTVKEILSGAELDTPATRRLLLNLSKKRNFVDALQLVYNSMLKGSGEGVIKIK